MGSCAIHVCARADRAAGLLRRLAPVDIPLYISDCAVAVQCDICRTSDGGYLGSYGDPEAGHTGTRRDNWRSNADTGIVADLSSAGHVGSDPGT